jgi:3-deoxy-D-manno-octulosonic-acid transferase
VVVSGRLSEASLRRRRRFSRVLGSPLHRLSAVGARTSLDAERFAALGVPTERIRVTGDLKLDTPDRLPELAPELSGVLPEKGLFVAGSTHAGEERAALQAFEMARASGGASALVLAPRHPQRFAEVETLLRASGHAWRRRNALGPDPLADGEVLLLDSLGELAAVFGRADVAFVGGSLVEVGGHNVLEPILTGCPVVVGPHTQSIQHVVDLLHPTGALERVDDAAGLGWAVVAAFRDPQAARRRGDAGRRRLVAERGCAGRAADLVDDVLAGRLGTGPGTDSGTGLGEVS